MGVFSQAFATLSQCGTLAVSRLLEAVQASCAMFPARPGISEDVYIGVRGMLICDVRVLDNALRALL